MSQSTTPSNRFRIVLYLFAVAIAVLVTSGGIYISIGAVGLDILSISVSAVLTAALVILYFRQTSILDEQRNLLTQELNREARQQHTETLRERVQLWHGNPGITTANDPIEGPDRNFPIVKRTSFESAPQGEFAESRSNEDQFRVVPHFLDGDRYLEDLLDNHARDLKETRRDIQHLHARFISLRNQFPSSIDYELIHETDTYTVEPTDFFYRWLFELLVMNERGFLEDFEDIRDRAFGEFERGRAEYNSNANCIWIQVELGGHNYRAIYSAERISGQVKEPQKFEDDSYQSVRRILGGLFDQMRDEVPYDHIQEAAATLDEAQASIEQLEQLLIEYDGRPIYPGECQYLSGAQIDGQ